MAHPIDLLRKAFEANLTRLEEDDKKFENGISIDGTPSAASVEKVVAALERLEQEKRKCLSWENNQEEQLGDERKNEGVKELVVVSRDTEQPPLTRNNMPSEDGCIKRWFKSKFKKRKKCDEVHLTTEEPSAKNVYLIDTFYKLHDATKNNNITDIKMFIESNYELNDEDLSESTPLLIAVMNQNFNAARLLHEAHVEVLMKKLFGTNSSSRSRYEFDNKKNVQIAHTNLLTQKMIERKFTAMRIGKVLAELHCNLEEVVKNYDSVMTKSYLQSCSGELKPWHLSFPFQKILDFDLNHIEVVLNYGPYARDRKEIFVDHLAHEIQEYEKSLTGRNFLKKLASSDIVDEDFAIFLEKYLQLCPRKTVKIIFKYNFHTIIEKKCGRNIQRICFGNSLPKVIGLLKNDEIDVDKRYDGNNTSLHIASKFSSSKNIQMLLYKGGDPNAFNDEHDTPLSLALRMRSDELSCPATTIKYLLLAGANPMIVTDRLEDKSFGLNSEYIRYSYKKSVIEMLLAQLAIYNAEGQSIEKPLKKLLSLGNSELEIYFKECCRQLEALKTQDICDNSNVHRDSFKPKFSIFKILTEKPEKIVCYINEELLLMITNTMKTLNRKLLHIYYRDMLRYRIKEIVELHHFRCKAIQFISHFTGINDCNHLVVDRIANYLTAKDLKVFKDTNKKI